MIINRTRFLTALNLEQWLLPELAAPKHASETSTTKTLNIIDHILQTRLFIHFQYEISLTVWSSLLGPSMPRKGFKQFLSEINWKWHLKKIVTLEREENREISFEFSCLRYVERIRNETASFNCTAAILHMNNMQYAIPIRIFVCLTAAPPLKTIAFTAEHCCAFRCDDNVRQFGIDPTPIFPSHTQRMASSAEQPYIFWKCGVLTATYYVNELSIPNLCVHVRWLNWWANEQKKSTISSNWNGRWMLIQNFRTMHSECWNCS